MSHGTHMDESWQMYEWVMAHTYIGHPHVWMSHGTHITNTHWKYRDYLQPAPCEQWDPHSSSLVVLPVCVYFCVCVCGCVWLGGWGCVGVFVRERAVDLLNTSLVPLPVCVCCMCVCVWVYGWVCVCERKTNHTHIIPLWQLEQLVLSTALAGTSAGRSS